ncbi:MAG: hypothetical protein V3T14_06165 [Myxococcota bacterium]
MAWGSPDDIRAELRHARQSGRIHGAYLFDGPPGTLKVDVAAWFARLLLCTGSGPDPCEACSQCRLSTVREPNGSPFPEHPDLCCVGPERGIIRIEQARALQRALELAPNEGGWRIGVILSADRLRTEAANALLKTLEEPRSRTTLILVADQVEALPRTVRSRVVRLRLVPEPEHEIATALEGDGLTPEDARLAAALGGGSQVGARAWVELHLDQARGFREFVEGARDRNDTEILEFALGFRGGGEGARARIELFLDVHGAVTLQQLRGAASQETDESVELWLSQADRGLEARRELIRRNLNPQLVVESLLLGLHREAR